VCLGKKETGHLLDLVPDKERKEFDAGISIFKAFSNKFEHYTHESSHFEP
jgi:hypothetical protein